MKKFINAISFSGVDGAGKTTILKAVKKDLSDQGYKVVELRSRPSILPILSSFKYGKKQAEYNATVSLPRTGKNKSKISSILRFLYYLSDYVFGQIFVYYRYTRRGYVILYDRFYFDYIIDPKRANLVLSSSFTRFFLRFVNTPDLNVFLYAPPDVILARKKELDHPTIQSLTHGYISLFEELSQRSDSTYLCIKNTDFLRTMSVISEYLVED